MFSSKKPNQNRQVHPEKSICVLCSLSCRTSEIFAKFSWVCVSLTILVRRYRDSVQHTKSLLDNYTKRRQTRHSHSLLLATVCTMLQVKVHWCKTDIDRKKGERRHVTHNHESASTVAGARLCGCYPSNHQLGVEKVEQFSTKCVHSTKLNIALTGRLGVCVLKN